jgi:hypothetical protein
MDISPNQALTPNKKQALLDEIQNELVLSTQVATDPSQGVVPLSLLDKAKKDLQDLLNKFLERKGIITPSETSDAIDKINASKRARLQQDYILGIKKGTLLLVGVFVLAIGGYIYYKKRSNGK